MSASADSSSERPKEPRSPPVRRRQRLLIALFIVGALVVVIREVSRFARELPARRTQEASARLLEAAAKQDIDGVSRAIASGADVRAADHQHRTALYMALEQRNLPLVDVLLGAGVDIDATAFAHDTSPLAFAVRENDLNLARHLLEMGADPNVLEAPIPGRQMLQHIIANGHSEMLELLLEYKADVPSLASLFVTRNPSDAKLRIMEVLIRHGADVKEPAAMDGAVLTNDSAAADLLRQHGADWGPREAVAFNRLEEVQRMIAGDPGVVRMKLQQIPNTSHLWPHGLTLLGIALEHGCRDVALHLLDAGAPLDSVESHGNSLLHLAAKGGNAELLKLLIDRGLSVDAVNERGFTPLHAAHRGEAMEVLIKSGADVNRVSNDGQTALLLAAFGRNIERTRLLLAAGADPTARGPDNRTALDVVRNETREVAQTAPHQELVDMLEQAVAKHKEAGTKAP